MSERNYLKTEAVFLAEKTPKKEVVITPPLREDSLSVTENGTYQAPIGRGYTDVNVNVAGAEPLLVTLTKNPNDDYYTADKNNAEIAEGVANETPIYLTVADTIFIVNMMRVIDSATGSSTFKATIPNQGAYITYADNYDNTTWELVNDETAYFVMLTWNSDLGNYVANKTNNEILVAIGNKKIPYVIFEMNDNPNFANFEFASPIMLAGQDIVNNLSFFQSQLYFNGDMITLYSDQTLPLSTNTNWYLTDTELATRLQVEEATNFDFTLTQQSSNASNTFVCNHEADDILFYCANNLGVGDTGDRRIPSISIIYHTNNYICVRNLEICNDGTLNVIYYDTQKTQMCKITHLPTDGDYDWTRSVL